MKTDNSATEQIRIPFLTTTDYWGKQIEEEKLYTVIKSVNVEFSDINLVKLKCSQVGYPLYTDFHSAKRFAQCCAQFIDSLEEKYIHLMGMGRSGAVLCSLTAAFCKRNIEFSFVPKKDEKSHQGGYSVNILPSDNIIIIDDIISSGKTLRQITDIINEYSKQVLAVLTSSEDGEWVASKITQIIPTTKYISFC
jgi:orotate phosphoribosyltransferase-like protein